MKFTNMQANPAHAKNISRSPSKLKITESLFKYYAVLRTLRPGGLNYTSHPIRVSLSLFLFLSLALTM